MASYVSARFEKTDLSGVLGKQRLIVRNKDDGAVPPYPSVSYFPTSPDALRDFLVVEYVNDLVGERFVRVATYADTQNLLVRPLSYFVDPTANFNLALTGQVIDVTIPTPEEWVSEEYPGTPFRFVISGIISATCVLVTPPFPSFKRALYWSIEGGQTGSQGTTYRTSVPAAGTYLDSRVNVLFNTGLELDQFIAARKSEIDSLASVASTITTSSENYTSKV